MNLWHYHLSSQTSYVVIFTITQWVARPPCQLPTFNTIAYGRNCLSYESAKTWNSLSTAIK